MKRFLATTFIVSGAMIAGGCATKKYVRKTTAPVQAKVDQVGEQAAKQAQEIQENRSPDQAGRRQGQSGISAAQERAQTAEARRRGDEPGEPGARTQATEVAQPEQRVHQ